MLCADSIGFLRDTFEQPFLAILLSGCLFSAFVFLIGPLEKKL
jgi:hypothetical protein